MSEFIDQEKLRRLFVKYDRDRDNKLNFNEFYQMINEINENYTELLLTNSNNNTRNTAPPVVHVSIPQNFSAPYHQSSQSVTNNRNEVFQQQQQQQMPIDDQRYELD